ncbi:MAG: hypothetical protein QW156_02580 [Candidatus Aenigmatarchaeota archaeon]
MSQQDGRAKEKYLKDLKALGQKIWDRREFVGLISGFAFGTLAATLFPKTEKIEKIEKVPYILTQTLTKTETETKEVTREIGKTTKVYETTTITKPTTLTHSTTTSVTTTQTITSTITELYGKSKGGLADIAPLIGDGRRNIEELYVFPRVPYGGYTYFIDDSVATFRNRQMKRFIQSRGIHFPFDYARGYIKIERKNRTNPRLEDLLLNLSFWNISDERKPVYLEIEREEPLPFALQDMLDVGEKVKVFYSLNGRDYNFLGEIEGV